MTTNTARMLIPYPLIHGQDEVKVIRRREAALQIQVAERNLEAVELRRELNTAWSSADPNVIQLKQVQRAVQGSPQGCHENQKRIQ